MPEQYRLIRQRYEEVLHLAQCPAAVSGKTIDLTTDEMRQARVFAFERVTDEGEHLTVVANFGDEAFAGRLNDQDIQVPAHDAVTIE